MAPVYGSRRTGTHQGRRRSPARRAAPQASVGIDLHPQALGGTGHRGQPVAQGGVVGRPDQPAVAVRRDGEPPDRRPRPRHRPGRPGPAARPGPRTAGARASRGAPAPARTAAPGSACTAARSTSWSGMRVWTSSRPPPSRVPTSRAARARRASVSSPAPKRGASRCWSMSRKATTSARATRWRAASVPTTRRASRQARRRRRGPRMPVTSTASTPVRAESSSVARVTPIRRDFRRVGVALGAHRSAGARRTAGSGARRRTRPGPWPPRTGCTGPARRSGRRPGAGPDRSG